MTQTAAGLSESDVWPSMVSHTLNMCSAFHPFKYTHAHTHAHTHTHTHTHTAVSSEHTQFVKTYTFFHERVSKLQVTHMHYKTI